MSATNASQVKKELKRIAENDIPYAISKAYEKAVREGVKSATSQAERDLDRPTSTITNPSPAGGAIRGQWPRKSNVKSGARKAMVYVVGVGAPAGGQNFDLVDEIHSLVYGGVVKHVPDRADTVLIPTRALVQGIAGQGRIKLLNQYGNIKGLRGGVLKAAKANKELYLSVGIGSTSKDTAHLSPGLYFKVREVVPRGTRATKSRLKHSKAKPRSKNRVVARALVKLLHYVEVADRAAIYDYVDAIRDRYEVEFPDALRDELDKAVNNNAVR